MSLLSWRRLHGQHIVAQVNPAPGDDHWTVCVSNDSESSDGISLRKRFELLRSAQAAADNEARRHFRHRCDFSTCGEWVPWMDVQP